MTAKTAKEVGRKAGVRIKKAVDELVGKTLLDLQAAGLMDPNRKVSAKELMTALADGARPKVYPDAPKEGPKPKPPRVFSPPKGVIRGPLTLTHGGKRWRVADLLRCLPKYDPFAVRQAKRWYFDSAAAQKALDFFEKCLRFIEGADVAGKPFVLQRWQAAIVANLFGWKEQKTGLRRYRRCLLYVPRKNGKTPLAAGILLYVAFLDHEPGAQIYTAASDKEQASLIYRHAAMMAQNEPILAKRCRAYRSHKTIEIPMTATFVRVLASDAHNKHGQNAHLVVIDELHAHQDDGELCRVLITSTASRTQPLVMYTTTADFLQESECNRVYDQFDRVRNGEAGESGDRFLPIMYEADLTDDWTQPAVWAKANPNLGVSVRPDYLAEQVDEAKRNHLLQNDFCRLHLNIRTEVAEKAFDMTHWAGCWKPSPQYSDAVGWRSYWLAKLRGEKCHAGVDLSSTDDVTALVLFFPAHKLLLPFFWCPTAKLDARQKKSAFTRYRDWQRDGFIMPLDGDYVDQDLVFEQMKLVAKDYRILRFAFDRWGADWIYSAMVKRDWRAERYGQSYREMTPPFKEVTKWLAAGELQHGDNPVLNWMARNAAVEHDNFENVRIAKHKSADKIDGIAASLMAVGSAMTDEDVMPRDSLLITGENISKIESTPDADLSGMSPMARAFMDLTDDDLLG